MSASMSMNMPNSLNLKIQDGGGRQLEFRKNVNNSGLHIYVDLNCIKVGGQMQHGQQR